MEVTGFAVDELVESYFDGESGSISAVEAVEAGKRCQVLEADLLDYWCD